MTKPVLVVMAAGMGSRYGGLKQLDPVGGHGQVIMDYSIYDARRAGFETVVFVIKPEIEAQFKAAVGDRIARGMDVKYAFQRLEDLPEGYAVPEERVKPWGTAQAVLSAREVVKGPFAVINADDYYGPQAFREIYRYLSDHPDGERYEYAMVGYQLKNTVTENGHVARGVCEETADSLLTAITERTHIESTPAGPRYTEDNGQTWTELSGETIVSMNLWGFTPGYIARAKAGFAEFLRRNLPVNPLKCEYYLPSVVTAALEAEAADVQVLTSRDKWYGITYREDKPDLVAALRKMSAYGLYPADRLF